jgi:hypothetical protein
MICSRLMTGKESHNEKNGVSCGGILSVTVILQSGQQRRPRSLRII